MALHCRAALEDVPDTDEEQDARTMQQAAALASYAASKKTLPPEAMSPLLAVLSRCQAGIKADIAAADRRKKHGSPHSAAGLAGRAAGASEWSSMWVPPLFTAMHATATLATTTSENLRVPPPVAAACFAAAHTLLAHEATHVSRVTTLHKELAGAVLLPLLLAPPDRAAQQRLLRSLGDRLTDTARSLPQPKVQAWTHSQQTSNPKQSCMRPDRRIMHTLHPLLGLWTRILPPKEGHSLFTMWSHPSCEQNGGSPTPEVAAALLRLATVVELAAAAGQHVTSAAMLAPGSAAWAPFRDAVCESLVAATRWIEPPSLAPVDAAAECALFLAAFQLGNAAATLLHAAVAAPTAAASTAAASRAAAATPGSSGAAQRDDVPMLLQALTRHVESSPAVYARVLGAMAAVGKADQPQQVVAGFRKAGGAVEAAVEALLVGSADGAAASELAEVACYGCFALFGGACASQYVCTFAAASLCTTSCSPVDVCAPCTSVFALMQQLVQGAGCATGVTA